MWSFHVCTSHDGCINFCSLLGTHAILIEGFVPKE